jgi:hypothetical protein
MAVELYKTANAQTSLICEAMLGHLGSDGQVYNKIGLVLVLRDNTNKALKTLRYYLDIPVAKVLCHDLWEGTLRKEYKEFKKTSGNKERAFQIAPNEGNGYRVSIMNSSESGERDRLYFQLSRWEARQLAITVLDYLRAYEIAAAISAIMGKKVDGKEKNGEETK